MSEHRESESVITEEMRSVIGVEGPPQEFEITTTGVRMFARAVGYEDPVFYDREEAKKRGFRDLPAPPCFLGTPVFNPATHDPMYSIRKDAHPKVPIPYPFGLNGGNDVEYHDHDLCAGDRLIGTTCIEGIEERYSSSLGSPMLIMVTATRYKRPTGELVAISRHTAILYGPRKEG